MKLYTRRGDSGLTDLFGGQRVDKDTLRVEAYGTVDELNSVLGLAAAAAATTDLEPILITLQSRLFEIGADLATPRPANAPADANPAIPRIQQPQIDELEHYIDVLCDALPEMKQFILPGGSELAARLHLARTVCRRAERLCVTLARQEPIGEAVIIYLNRLSDLLFAMARRANQLAGLPDVPWQSPRQRPAEK